MLIVETEDRQPVKRDLVYKIQEHGLDLVHIFIIIKVFGIYVRHHCDCRRKMKKRSVTFVRLGDNKLSPAQHRIGAEAVQSPADYYCRIKRPSVQHLSYNGCSSGLAVRPCNRDPVFQMHQFRQHLRPRDDRDGGGPGRHDFRVIRSYRR